MVYPEPVIPGQTLVLAESPVEGDHSPESQKMSPLAHRPIKKRIQERCHIKSVI